MPDEHISVHRTGDGFRQPWEMQTMTRCTICGPEPINAPDTDCPDDTAHRAAVADAVARSEDRPRLPYVCKCGQLSGDAKVCDTCRATERAPQGETVRLFQPAPAPITGQLQMPSAPMTPAAATTLFHLLAITAR